MRWFWRTIWREAHMDMLRITLPMALREAKRPDPYDQIFLDLLTQRAAVTAYPQGQA